MSSNVPDRFTVPPSAGHIAWGTRAAGAALLAERPQRALPRVRRRRRGLVLAHLHRDGRRVLGPQAVGRRHLLGRPDLPRPDGRPRRPDDLRLRSTTAPATGRSTPRTRPRSPAWRPGSPGCTRWTRWSGSSRPASRSSPSQSFLASELDGANYGTSGHLFVVVGFTADGDVIVNDPASSSNDVVRNVYKREQFEQIWLRTKRYQRQRRRSPAAPAASRT